MITKPRKEWPPHYSAISTDPDCGEFIESLKYAALNARANGLITIARQLPDSIVEGEEVSAGTTPHRDAYRPLEEVLVNIGGDVPSNRAIERVGIAMKNSLNPAVLFGFYHHYATNL